MSARVLLVVIDAATPRVVCPAIRTGLFPTLQRLAEAGTMHEQSVTIFPSITPAATTSIITGCYPFEHGIAGASWFDAARDEVAYYGDDFWVIAREGFGEFIRDFLLRLNGDRLTAPTLFELVERTGRTAACLNYLVYKGLSAHQVAIPPGLAALPGVPFTATVEGPSVLSLGDFVGPRTPHGHKLDEKGGIFHRFGMDDESTGAMLRDLFAEGSQSDLTVAYFADNDYRSHEIGPYRALPVIGRIDDLLAEAFDAAGGMDRVLENTYVIVTSDHGHCEISANATRSVIQLDELLGEFSQATLGSAWQRGDQIMICPNMRAAQIYMHQPEPRTAAQIVAAALRDPRIDLAIRRASATEPAASGYIVTAQKGEVWFARGEQGGRGSYAKDAFGAAWTWSGDSIALDFEVSAGRIEYGDFPNAFERIAGVLDLDQAGDIWVTAKPGCEFRVPGGDAHVGGASHGGLHALDSLSPVIVAGPAPVFLPRHLRSVDLAPLVTWLLGMEMRYSVGEPR